VKIINWKKIERKGMKVTTGQDTIINNWVKLMGPVSHFDSFDWSQKVAKKQINKRPIMDLLLFSDGK